MYSPLGMGNYENWDFNLKNCNFKPVFKKNELTSKKAYEFFC